MTTEFHDDSEQPQPLGLGSSEGLGALVERLRFLANGPDAPHRTAMLEAADALELIGLRHKVQVSTLRTAVLVAQGALSMCNPCAAQECQVERSEWVQDAMALCEQALAPNAQLTGAAGTPGASGSA